MRRMTIVAVVVVLLGAGSAIADLFADFSKSEIRSDFPIRTYKADNNPHYGGSYRLLEPNESFIDGTFNLPEKPNRMILTLKHLSSLARGANLDGESPITVVLNGNVVVRNLEPGSHGYVKDTLEITKFAREGENTIRIQFDNGTTHYWIKWMLIETD